MPQTLRTLLNRRWVVTLLGSVTEATKVQWNLEQFLALTATDTFVTVETTDRRITLQTDYIIWI